MAEKRDYYEVLGIGKNATDAEIKSAYRKLAKKYHPDQYADSPLKDLADEKMKESNEAYDAITAQRKGGGAGRLFGSVTTQEIADALKQSCGIELDRRKLVLDEPIKTTGIYTVRCKLGYEITADLRVEIKEQ